MPSSPPSPCPSCSSRWRLCGSLLHLFRWHFSFFSRVRNCCLILFVFFRQWQQVYWFHTLCCEVWVNKHEVLGDPCTKFSILNPHTLRLANKPRNALSATLPSGLHLPTPFPPPPDHHTTPHHTMQHTCSTSPHLLFPLPQPPLQNSLAPSTLVLVPTIIGQRTSLRFR